MYFEEKFTFGSLFYLTFGALGTIGWWSVFVSNECFKFQFNWHLLKTDSTRNYKQGKIYHQKFMRTFWGLSEDFWGLLRTFEDYWGLLKTFENFLRTFWGLFSGDFLGTFWELSGDFLGTFWGDSPYISSCIRDLLIIIGQSLLRVTSSWYRSSALEI